jgi:uncharacterized protein YllA (UPF0747 family)
MLHQFQALEQKAGRASAFRAGVLENHAKEISSALYPDGRLQERVYCLLPAIAEHGMDFLDRLGECIKPGSTDHLVVHP